jgi:predicted DNA-binding protein
MPTIKQRINISVGKDTRDALKAYARKSEVPVATAAAKLIEEALEREEDGVLARIVEKRLREKKVKWVSHKSVWKHLST